MKSKKWMLLATVVMSALLFCAFTVIPTVHLSRESEHNVGVSYLNAQANTNKLVITVNYDNKGESFEIGSDIVVASDNNFANPLRMKSCNIVNGNYVYEFDAVNANKLKTVYIKPPILYMPTEISPVTVPLMAGQIARVSSNNSSFTTAGANWFSVDSIDIEKESEGTYLVKVIINAESLDLPRFPKLVNGKAEFGGISALYFDENDDFETGEFIFYVKANNEKEVATIVAGASLVVSDALLRVDAENLNISSSIKSLSVVAK